MTDLNRAFKNIQDMMQFTSENLARSADTTRPTKPTPPASCARPTDESTRQKEDRSL